MLETGEFKKFDYGNAHMNMQRYGQPEPPHYNLKNLRGFNFVLVCGKNDLLACPEDYLWLKEELAENGNVVEFFESESGHSGLLFPKEKSATENILNAIIDQHVA
uniref:Uncharacterized protein n=1 Tax=Strombidium inclinatum TaxID=197538 RepID=A0A7S3IGR4_9SPIT|mmetsp:Transcript_17821/g.27580  ORF Transcript_17821/g.27580 Transcript_17821/m.27580 type:complete len:105 (+) Transcript_17821:991-1305(+)